MLLARRVMKQPDALALDAPLRTRTTGDEQLAIRAKFQIEPVTSPLRAVQRALVQRAGVRRRRDDWVKLAGISTGVRRSYCILDWRGDGQRQRRDGDGLSHLRRADARLRCRLLT